MQSQFNVIIIINSMLHAKTIIQNSYNLIVDLVELEKCWELACVFSFNVHQWCVFCFTKLLRNYSIFKVMHVTIFQTRHCNRTTSGIKVLFHFKQKMKNEKQNCSKCSSVISLSVRDMHYKLNRENACAFQHSNPILSVDFGTSSLPQWKYRFFWHIFSWNLSTLKVFPVCIFNNVRH